MSVQQLPYLTFVVLACTRLALAQPAEGFDATPFDPTPFDAAIDELHYEVDMPEVPELVVLRVRHGESLYDLARWTRVTIEDLETLNDIDLHTPLKAGQRLEVALTTDEISHFEARRSKFHDRRRARYLKRRGGLVEVKAHRIRTGESLWSLARANGRIPMWLVAAYNEDRNLDRLAIGDTVQIPVVGDTVAAR